MQTADLIFVSIAGLMVDVYNIPGNDRLSVEMASENSSEDEFDTLHYLLK